ncbi:hypothetical protein [Thermococcus sp.]
MGIFEEGKTDCIRELLMPAERVIRQGPDIQDEDFSRREKLWIKVEENYNRYLDGECGSFLADLDSHFRSKFEGAMAVLAWSFWHNGEIYPPAQKRYKNKEILAVDRILRYSVFEIMSREDVLKKLVARDEKLLGLLREYYLGMDEWIEEVLNDQEIKLALRHFLKNKWNSYKGKVNEAISEAVTRLDWFRPLMAEWERQKQEEIGAVEAIYQRQISGLRSRLEKEKEELRKKLETAKEEEIYRLIRDKEEMERRFEEERQRLIEEISKMKDEEARKQLEEQLRKVREEMLASVQAMEEEIRRKELELRQKEMELRKKELELAEKEDEVSKKIREVMSLAGKVEKGSRFVKRDEARILEMNFVGRIRSRFRGEVKLLGKTFSVRSIEEKSTFEINRYEGKLSERDLKNIPDNRLVEIRLREKKLFGKKEEITVKALFYSRPERYAEVGFDTDPLELADINALLVDARKDAGTGRIVLLVASPTGFEKRIAHYVDSSDFHRNFISENVSLALLDLESGELIYNPHDEYAKAFAPMLHLERDEELLSRIKDFLEEKIAAKGYVRFDEAVENFTEEAVKRAFHELSKEKGYATKFIEGVGYVLVREGFL